MQRARPPAAKPGGGRAFSTPGTKGRGRGYAHRRPAQNVVCGLSGPALRRGVHAALQHELHLLPQRRDPARQRAARAAGGGHGIPRKARRHAPGAHRLRRGADAAAGSRPVYRAGEGARLPGQARYQRHEARGAAAAPAARAGRLRGHGHQGPAGKIRRGDARALRSGRRAPQRLPAAKQRRGARVPHHVRAGADRGGRRGRGGAGARDGAVLFAAVPAAPGGGPARASPSYVQETAARVREAIGVCQVRGL